jgi:carbamoyltransferase
MITLGISAFYHDSAAALIVDGEIVAAAQEERFTRIKHDSNYPQNAIEFCIKEAKIDLKDVDQFIFYDKPIQKFVRLLETAIAFAPTGYTFFKTAMPLWIKEKLFQKDILIKTLSNSESNVDWEQRLLFSEHHLSHAASAFFPSPFEEAAILTMDGVGEWTTTSFAVGNSNNISIEREIHFPHSLGLLYSAFTYYAGFRVNSGEYKLMGLAPYGDPKYASLIRENLIDVKQDGSFRLNMDYFNYGAGLTMVNQHFCDLFGQPTRTPDALLTQFHMDIAASIQAVTEDVVRILCRSLAKETNQKNLCLAGGVALNCVANGKILNEEIFENIWIQPAAGDAGGALGAALIAHHIYNDQPRLPIKGNSDSMKGSYLGPSYSQSDIEQSLIKLGAKFEVLNEKELVDHTAKILAEGQAVGWMQGKMEFGPRALGNRSILGDPRSPKMQQTLNLKVKHRESFRPFAPSILQEQVSEWFVLENDSPYMLFVADVHKDKCREMNSEQHALFGIDKLNVQRSDIPAVTHVDYSARIQTVHQDTNSIYHALISKFFEDTGCPILINTSFNVRGEPIICTPEDAFLCFMGTDLDALVIGNCVLSKELQDETLKHHHVSSFELD